MCYILLLILYSSVSVSPCLCRKVNEGRVPFPAHAGASSCCSLPLQPPALCWMCPTLQSGEEKSFTSPHSWMVFVGEHQKCGVGKASGGRTVPALPRILGAASGGSDKLGIKTLSCSSCRGCSLLVSSWSGAGSLLRHGAPSPHIATLAAMIFIQ